MDGGVWQTTVHRATKSWTRLKRHSMHTHQNTLLHKCGYIIHHFNRLLLYIISQSDCDVQCKVDFI